MNLLRSFAVTGAAVACAIVSSTAFAQSAGFALNRYEPSERGSEWFMNESLDLRGDPRFAAGLVLDYARKPLVIYTPDGDERAAVVGHQLFAHVGAAVTLIDRLRFGVNLPVAAFQDGDDNATLVADNATTIGDLRLSADVRIAGEVRDPVTFAGGLQLWAPTGSQDAFTGDGKVRVRPRLMLAGDIGAFTYAGQTGLLFRARDEAFEQSPLGSEVTLAVAAGARLLEGNLVVGPELATSTVVTESDAVFARTTTPLEVIAGAHYTIDKSWRVGAGIGPGLTRGLGTPQFRALASIEWIQPLATKEEALPPPPPPDRDGDNILDLEDACPDVPGVPTDNPATHGCPPPGDRDGDSILDPVDACPDVRGVASEDPKLHGCPPPDRDGDKVIDAEDACPDEAGVRTDDPKTNGCPPPKDRDGDGILDEEDACPDLAGPSNEDPKKNGCPVAHVDKGQIRIREQVQFAYNSARILASSNFILEAVKNILASHPEIKKVQVQGHTDNKGAAAYNLNLSKRRAESVMKWLVDNGIDKSRLEAKGFGKNQPIDTNDTEEGRANNRRVEFHINEQNAEAKPE
jgi:OmpA-OmpF porin, OOP family